jgi:hypothetical protein
MAARLGHVLYWLGCIIAGLLALFAVIIVSEGQSRTEYTWYTAAFVLVFAVAAWLIGRACRYVLAGK